MPPKEQILDFLDKNCLNIKDLREITGKGDQTIRDWLDWLKGKKSTPKFPWDAWLLLNALFNKEAPFVAEIIGEYSKGDALDGLRHTPGLAQSIYNKAEDIKKAWQSLNDASREILRWRALDRIEEGIERLTEQHFKRVMKEYYNWRGTGPRVEKREEFRQIREIENALDIEKAVIFQDFKGLAEEYNPDKKDGSFIKKLLTLYDEYIKQVENERTEKYLNNLGEEIENRIKGKKPRKRIRLTPEQEAAVVELVKKEKVFDKYVKKSPNLEKKPKNDGSEPDDMTNRHESLQWKDKHAIDDEVEKIEIPLTVCVEKERLSILEKNGSTNVYDGTFYSIEGNQYLLLKL